jgi:hypothetical protein
MCPSTSRRDGSWRHCLDPRNAEATSTMLSCDMAAVNCRNEGFFCSDWQKFRGED